jgi:hypothetical protein
MCSGTTLTSHAAMRLSNRSSLTPKEVKRILDDCLFVLISKEKDSPRAHKLIFDEKAQNYIVAVQDEVNGEVVTFHPTHHNDEIPGEAFLEAKRLVLESEPFSSGYMMQFDQVIRFRFEVQDIITGKIRSLVLKLPGLGYIGNPDLEMDVDLQNKFVSFLSDSLKPGEALKRGYVKTSNKSRCRPFSVEIVKDLLSKL